jgi:hypothetical protein
VGFGENDRSGTGPIGQSPLTPYIVRDRPLLTNSDFTLMWIASAADEATGVKQSAPFGPIIERGTYAVA